jgi:hypothetical protein
MDAIAQAPLLLGRHPSRRYTPPFARHPRCTALACPRRRRPMRRPAGNVLGSARVPAELATVLADKAAGVPLRVEELTRTLFAIGRLQRDGSGYRMVTSIGDAEVPATFEGVVAARLDRLPDGAKRALQLCSVIGAQIPKRLLDRAAESATQLNGALGELERHDILALGPRGCPLYRIRHAVVQDVAYRGCRLRAWELHRFRSRDHRALEAERLPETSPSWRSWQSAEQWAKALGTRSAPAIRRRSSPRRLPVVRGARSGAARTAARRGSAARCSPVPPDHDRPSATTTTASATTRALALMREWATAR